MVHQGTKPASQELAGRFSVKGKPLEINSRAAEPLSSNVKRKDAAALLLIH
jgi:hypothetical protein